MCGIAGLINLREIPISPLGLKRMGDAIAHRGPDGAGQWVEGCAGLVHRRLAIIDPTPAGNQPMISADHRWVLTYNGEIYNYQEIKADLEAEGVWFRSKTDSEVVLYALAKWGVRALELFNGMFALALWDRQNQELLIARDRYGVKPLYYSHQGGTFAFGSEQKAILKTNDFEKKLNNSALLEYFTFQNILTNQTLIHDINLLSPGHYGTISLDKPFLKPRQYWDYEFKSSGGVKCAREYKEELDRLFVQAVNRQLISDVDLGAYLSGGIDSGLITAIAAKQIPYLKSFTCGFDLSSASGIELSFDERAKAEAMSALFDTEHYEMVLKAGDMERCLPSLAWHLEEPRVGQSYPNYYAANLASKFVKVVLTGSGGDELFGGYPWRYFIPENENSYEDYIDQYYRYWQRLVSNTEIKKLLSPVWHDVKHVWTRDIFKGLIPEEAESQKSPEYFVNMSLRFEAKTFLHGLFVVEDKLSMAHGLENRVVFMDNDLVDFAMKCPVELKLKNLKNKIRIDENIQYGKQMQHYQKTKDGKLILREMASNYIPESIAQAKKQGFSSPDASWFRGKSIDFVVNTLGNKKSEMYDLVDYEFVQTILTEHINGKSNRRLLIWSLLNINEYLKGVGAS